MYCGYLPMTHDGLMETVNEAAPFAVPAMIFSGASDVFASLAPALAEKFSDRLEEESPTAGHYLPFASDATYDLILSFIH